MTTHTATTTGPACGASPADLTEGNPELVTCLDCVDRMTDPADLDALITEVCTTIQRLHLHPSQTPGKLGRAYDLKLRANARLMALDHMARARELTLVR